MGKHHERTSLGSIRSDLRSMTPEQFYDAVVSAEKTMSLPWAKKLSQVDYRQNVLPTRADTEPLTRSRQHFYEALLPLVSDANSLEEAFLRVHSLVSKLVDFGYDIPEELHRLSVSPYTTLGTNRAGQRNQGNFLITLSRTIGIPAQQIRINNERTAVLVKDNDNYLIVHPSESDARDPLRYRGQGLEQVIARDPWTFERRDITDKVNKFNLQ